MDAFANIGSASISSAVIAVNICSMVVMAAIVAEFLHIQHKRVNLLRALMSERADAEHKQGRTLMWLCTVSTIAIACITFFIYFVRPHLL